MRIAVIGAGRIGRAHAATLAALDTVDHVVVADAVPARAADVAVQTAGAAAVAIEEVFAGGVDGAVIAAPTAEHGAVVERCLEAGLPAFCEKPIAEDLPRSVAVARLVAASATPVQIGFQRRFDPGYRAARQALRGGELGELRRAHLTTCDPSPPPAEFIAASGGIFRDCHVHDLDILRWVTGREILWVTAFGAQRGADYFRELGEVAESAGVVGLDDGTIATFQGSRTNGQGYDVRMELAGTLGQRTVGLDDRVPLVSAEAGVSFPREAPWTAFAERFAAAYVAELEAFVELVAGRGPNRCTAADVLASMLAAEAADLSYRQGRTVHLSELRDLV